MSTIPASAVTPSAAPRSPATARHAGSMLALGFGTTVAMWGVGYVCRLSPTLVPSWALLVLMVAVLFAGCFVAGRTAPGGWKIGLKVGTLASVLNLLILGSLLTGDSPNRIVPSALWWLPGSLLAGALVGTVAGALGRRGRVERLVVNWTGVFAVVAASATYLLLIAGGIVTGHEAGLAVVDWPNSFGYNMFLYPMSRMTGGIYYEHAHRLFGSLVGLTTLVLAVRLQIVEKRRSVRIFAIVALLAVIVQGIMGGLRVTGDFTTSTSPAEVAPSLTLAVVHGVFGQVFFAMMVALAVFTSRSWIRRASGVVRSSAGFDRALATGFVLVVITQLVFGALVRHMSNGLLIHISMAVFVVLVGTWVGFRAWGSKPRVPKLSQLGPYLIGVLWFQFLLGFGALLVTSATADLPTRPLSDVIVTTLHQATGAAILALAVVIMLWSYKLLTPRRATNGNGATNAA